MAADACVLYAFRKHANFSWQMRGHNDLNRLSRNKKRALKAPIRVLR
jgi:hypothetical protein